MEYRLNKMKEITKMKIDWKRKLTSRKFWLALVGLATSLLVAFNVDENSIAQVTSIITAAASVVAYILAEGFVDGKSAEGDNVTFELAEPNKSDTDEEA